MGTQKSQKLEDQAATAALYATRPDKGSVHERHDRHERSDDSSRLSSAGAATSLKYASPVDLPSYPTAGLINIESSAEAAASLANANHQYFEHWKPDASETASKAAVLAKDYRSTDLWQPQRSSAGSRAAALAAKDVRRVDIWHPEATEAGNSAAGQAMRGNGLSSQARSAFTAERPNKALLAATGAMSGGRKRSGSSPIKKSTYPDSENSAANALSAASFANKSSLRSSQVRRDVTTSPSSASMDAARLKTAAVTNLPREMYTSNPPVAPEVEEKNRQAGQRAAAISMAKQMYDIQQRAITQAQEGDRSDSHVAASYLHNRKQSAILMEEAYQSPPQYANLQEAAQRLAAERLAKLHDEHAAYRNYYGTNVTSQSRLSVRNRPRRRASSDGGAHTPDDNSSKLSHPDISFTHERSAQIDAKKRQKDRDLLMAAAQRNVKASMQSMDEKVFSETGRPSPAMVEDWESKANARAKAASEARLVNHGKVNIGGGKYLDQSEIDEIAAKRVQPTLDEISEKAAIQRARDADRQREEQERNRIAATKIQDDKERTLRTKAEWKRFRDEEKREAKARKEEERSKRVDERQSKTENKRLLISEAEPGIGSQGGHAIDIESTIHESSPGLGSSSDEEPNKPASGTLQTEANVTEPGSPNKLPLEEQPRLVKSDSNEVEAISEVDPSLLDPALREPAETNHGNLRPSADPSHAELVAARVLNAPAITEASTEEATLPDETRKAAITSAPKNDQQDSIVDPPHQSGAMSSVSDSLELPENMVPSDAETPPSESTQVPPSGPLAAPRSPKGESRVTSWLKTKFGRRAVKTTEPLIGSSSQDSGDLAAPSISRLVDDESRDDDSPTHHSDSGDEQTRTHITTGAGRRDSSARSARQSVDQHGRNSHSISSMSSDEDARVTVPVAKQRTSSSHEDFKEARDYLDSEENSEKPFATAISRDAEHSLDKQVRDSKFQENL